MTGGKIPFPQFDDDAFEGNTPRERAGSLIRAIVARTESTEAEEPHAVLSYDPECDAYIAYGPYDTAYRANHALSELDAELNDPKINDGPSIVFTVIPIRVP